MFDFKRGKASDKVLSEQEIQQKLYGRFLTNKNAVAGASESYTRPAPKVSNASSAAVLFPEETTEERSSVDTRTAESLSDLRTSEKKVDIKEPTSIPASKEIFRDRFQSTENDLLKVNRVKSAAPKPIFKPVLPKIQLPKIPFQALLSRVFSGAAVIFNAIFGVFFKISRVVDFRKEGVRTGLAWGSGVVMLVVLLAAIQGLNSKREIAMKTAVPRAPKKISAKAVTKKIAPAAALSAESKTEAIAPLAGRNEKPLTPAIQEAGEGLKKADKAAATGRFVIQVATYVIRDDANRLLEDLQKIESRSFVKGLSRSSGKTYYSVFLGRFQSFQEGQQALAKFKKSDLSRSFKDAFIRTLEA